MGYESDVKSSLLVLGNGFDLMHGMNTRWIDFQEWWLDCISSPQSMFVKKLKEAKSGNFKLSDCFGELLYQEDTDTDYLYFSNEEASIEEALFIDLCKCAYNHDNSMAGVWRDFESCLKDLMLPDIYSFLYSEEEDAEWKCAAYEEDQSLIIQEVLLLGERLRQWLLTVEPASRYYDKVRDLLASSELIISFNYTETVESLYHFNVEHLHGALSAQDNLITGCEPLKEDPFDSISWSYELNNEDFRASLVKPLQIKKLDSILSDLCLERVTTLGFGFGDVDFSYVKQIVDHTGENTVWTAYIHEPHEAENVVSTLEKAGYAREPLFENTETLTKESE